MQDAHNTTSGGEACADDRCVCSGDVLVMTADDSMVRVGDSKHATAFYGEQPFDNSPVYGVSANGVERDADDVRSVVRHRIGSAGAK